MRRFSLFLTLIVAVSILPADPAQSGSGGAQKALIVDGQNNHDWKSCTPVLARILEESGLFTVSVATTPGQGPRSEIVSSCAKRGARPWCTAGQWQPHKQRPRGKAPVMAPRPR